MAFNLARRIAALEDRLQLSKGLTMEEMNARLADRPGDGELDGLIRIARVVGWVTFLKSLDIEDDEIVLALFNEGVSRRQKRNW